MITNIYKNKTEISFKDESFKNRLKIAFALIFNNTLIIHSILPTTINYVKDGKVIYKEDRLSFSSQTNGGTNWWHIQTYKLKRSHIQKH